jgi:hypothetical protein
MVTTEIRVGRLYEHRLGTLASEDELTALRARGMAVMQSSARPMVVCADYRQVKFVKVELVAPFVEFLRAVSPKVERSAVLLAPDHAIFTLQMTRMVRDAAAPQRRTFEDPAIAEAWLSEVLSLEERARLHSFLAERLPEG